MFPKLALLFFVLALTALLVALDYQHGNRVTPPLLSATPAAKIPLELALKPVTEGQPTASLQQFEGRYVLINAWATWCPPCVTEFPHLMAMAKKYPKRLQLVTLSADRERATATAFLADFETLDNAYHAFDAGGKIARSALQIYRYPESLLLNDKGELVYKYAGVLQQPQLDEMSALIEQIK